MQDSIALWALRPNLWLLFVFLEEGAGLLANIFWKEDEREFVKKGVEVGLSVYRRTILRGHCAVH